MKVLLFEIVWVHITTPAMEFVVASQQKIGEWRCNFPPFNAIMKDRQTNQTANHRHFPSIGFASSPFPPRSKKCENSGKIRDIYILAISPPGGWEFFVPIEKQRRI